MTIRHYHVLCVWITGAVIISFSNAKITACTYTYVYTVQSYFCSNEASLESFANTMAIQTQKIDTKKGAGKRSSEPLKCYACRLVVIECMTRVHPNRVRCYTWCCSSFIFDHIDHFYRRRVVLLVKPNDSDENSTAIHIRGQVGAFAARRLYRYKLSR